MKVLIYIEESQLRPVGGHLGYNYNLYKEVAKHTDTDIEYLKIDKAYQSLKKKTNIDNWKYCKSLGHTLKLFVKHFLLEYGRHNAIIDLNQYDMVHFHSTLDMYQVRDSLKEYRGKVILTSHSPTLLSKEIYDSLRTIDKKIFAFLYNKLIRIDEYAFNRADYFIFPCPEAEEPYYHAWDSFKKIKELKSDRFLYVPTGINPCISKMNRKNLREKYNIPEDCFVLCYVGRHNEIKGYDILKTIGKEVLSKYSNAYILVAGKEEPLQGLKHDRWIEIGWTNDPHSIIAASDVFILPNRETYFDLIMLEVLSLGKIIVASNTGGNKFFTEVESVLLYSDKDDAVQKIESLITSSKERRKELECISKELYNNKFTCELFYRNYKDVYRQINNL